MRRCPLANAVGWALLRILPQPGAMAVAGSTGANSSKKGGIFWLETVDLRTSKKKTMELQQRLTYMKIPGLRVGSFGISGATTGNCSVMNSFSQMGNPTWKICQRQVDVACFVGETWQLGCNRGFHRVDPPGVHFLVIITGPCLVMST